MALRGKPWKEQETGEDILARGKVSHGAIFSLRLVETDVELGRSRRILRKMYLNVFTNKIVLVLIIVIEICILAGLLYWKFGTKH